MKTGTKGMGVGSREEEMTCFNEFIDVAQLIDLPLVERRFTWSRLDGSCMSHLDRFFVIK